MQNAPMIPAGSSVVELAARDLPVFCPNPSMPLWASHPRIFLDVVNEIEAMCPYCGTHYRLKPDVHVQDSEFDTRGLRQHREQHGAQPVVEQVAGPPSARREAPNVSVDARGNTTLEQMTLWLRGRR